MFGMIAAQQTRAARTDRHAALQRINDSLFQFGRVSEAQIIIRGEVDTCAPFERTQTTATVQGL
jgi:hypothetical protein